MSDVVLVHGLWYNGLAMRRLSDLVAREGFATHTYSYESRERPIAEHAARLADSLSDRGEGPLHYIAHSLGGLVVLAMLAERDDLPPGRVVLMGTPLRGSAVARHVSNWPGTATLLGRVKGGLERGFPHLPTGRQVGMIAGTLPLGLGVVSGGLRGTSDGMVGIDETTIEGLADRADLAVTHTGMLFSSEVAAAAARFLRHGRFGEGG